MKPRQSAHGARTPPRVQREEIPLNGTMKTLHTLVVLALPLALQATVVYQENFDNGTGSNVPIAGNLSAYGWTGHETLGASLITNSNAYASSSANGDSGNGTATGFLFNTSYNGFGDANQRTNLLWTDEVAALNILSTNINFVDWLQGNALTTDRYRVALRIGGSWYASNLAAAQSNPVSAGSDFSANATRVSLTFNSATWQTLAFNGTNSTNSGVNFALGNSTVLPTGNVTAAGLYIEQASGSRRFDTFRIDAIPEPSSAAILVASLGMLAARRSRRTA